MKVRLKTLKELKPYARSLGGDMSTSLHYFVKMADGKPIKTDESMNTSFTAKGFDVLEHGQEFLVVDHPNPISKDEYRMLKNLFKPKEDTRSMNGVC